MTDTRAATCDWRLAPCSKRHSSIANAGILFSNMGTAPYISRDIRKHCLCCKKACMLGPPRTVWQGPGLRVRMRPAWHTLLWRS